MKGPATLGTAVLFCITTLFSCQSAGKQEELAYYKDIPPISGAAQGVPREMFTVTLTIGYPLLNNKLALELVQKRLVIVDRVRNLLMRYPAVEFVGLNGEELKDPIRKEINKNLTSGEIITVLFNRIEIYPLPN